jgi:DNA ligase-1
MQQLARLSLLALCLCLAPFANAQTANAPQPLLANVANTEVDPVPYLVSEKYDGVRALWDGKALRSRAGNVFAAPAWFIAKLPKQAIDGELWIARGQFEKLSGAVRKTNPVDEEWRQIKYMIFELPDAPGLLPNVTNRSKRSLPQPTSRSLSPWSNFVCRTMLRSNSNWMKL